MDSTWRSLGCYNQRARFPSRTGIKVDLAQPPRIIADMRAFGLGVSSTQSATLVEKSQPRRSPCTSSPGDPLMVRGMCRGVVIMANGRLGCGESFGRGDFSLVSKNYRWATVFRGLHALAFDCSKNLVSLTHYDLCIE